MRAWIREPFSPESSQLIQSTSGGSLVRPEWGKIEDESELAAALVGTRHARAEGLHFESPHLTTPNTQAERAPSGSRASMGARRRAARRARTRFPWSTRVRLILFYFLYNMFCILLVVVGGEGKCARVAVDRRLKGAVGSPNPGS